MDAIVLFNIQIQISMKKLQPSIQSILDDGLIYVTEDGGDNWRKSDIPGVPARSFINDI